MSERADDLAMTRWRLVLGRFAEPAMPDALDGRAAARDRVLDYLYGREYERRGVRQDDAERTGTLGPSQLAVPEWIREVRDLFPADTCEIITRHALERYGMTQLVTDPETLERLEPSYELLRAVMTFKGLMKAECLDVARRLVRQVVEELKARLAAEVRLAMSGRRDAQRRTRMRVSRNLDLRRTVRANLARWDPARRRLLATDLHFRARVHRHLPWHIIMAVDCSGSMMDSVIHSAVMASIFRALPAVRVTLLAFDTAVVDLTEATDDPVEVLMSVQLGGGTNIGGAVGACAKFVEQPTRTAVVLVTDFAEGAPRSTLLAAIRQLRGDGVRVLGLAALDALAKPAYDRATAEACADAGAEIAAMTPRHLAEWMAQVLR